MGQMRKPFIPPGPESFPKKCPQTGLPIQNLPEWVYTNSQHTYRTTIALIGSKIFWVIPRGYITEQDMRQAISLSASILSDTIPTDGPFVFIENFAHVHGATAAARRLYLRFTNSLKGLLGSFPYGMPPFFRLSFNFSRRLRLHRYKVHMVANYNDAVVAAVELLFQNGLAPALSMPELKWASGESPPKMETPLPPVEAAGATHRDDGLSRHVDALLTHLGQLDLESPGIPDPPSIARQSELAPIYDAVAMLKMDMDQFLAEHRDLVTVLRARRKELLHQTAAIESRNKELQALLKQSSEGQKETGAVVLKNIRTLLKPLLKLIEDEMRIPHHRGWIHGLNAHIDALTADLIPRSDLGRYKLTPQELCVAKMIREGASTKIIATRLGLSLRTVDVYRGALRKKLGIRGKKINLRTALLAIPIE